MSKFQDSHHRTRCFIIKLINYNPSAMPPLPVVPFQLRACFMLICRRSVSPTRIHAKSKAAFTFQDTWVWIRHYCNINGGLSKCFLLQTVDVDENKQKSTEKNEDEDVLLEACNYLIALLSSQNFDKCEVFCVNLFLTVNFISSLKNKTANYVLGDSF